MARGQRAQRRSRASGASPTDAGPGLADLPPEVLSRVLDFLSPPCAAGRAPLADGFPERGCSCGGGRAALLPLLRTSSALFGHVAARLWGHLALEDLALNSAENLSEPISEEDARTVERGEMVLRALESPRGATYGGLVRRLSLKLPEGASILARRLAVALPHMQHLSHLLVFLAVRSTATLWGANPDLERIWVAARSLPGLRGVRIPALPPAAVFARGLRSWPELEALHLPDGSVPAQLVPEQGFGKALAAAAPPSLRSLRLDGRIPGSDLAKLIDRLPLLDHLSLGVPDWVTPASCAAVAKAAARLRSLSLVMIVQHDYAPEMPREEILEALCGPRLESLTVTHFPLDEELANALGRALVRCPRLTELRLHRTKPLLVPFHVPPLPPTLTSLYLGLPLPDGLLPPILAQLPDLACLDLAGSTLFAPDLVALSAHPTISSLGLHAGTRFRGRDLRAMLRATPRITRVALAAWDHRWDAFRRERRGAAEVLRLPVRHDHDEPWPPLADPPPGDLPEEWHLSDGGLAEGVLALGGAVQALGNATQALVGLVAQLLELPHLGGGEGLQEALHGLQAAAQAAQAPLGLPAAVQAAEAAEGMLGGDETEQDE